MKSFYPEQCERVKKWINKQVKTKWSPEEVKEALTLCDHIDEHWQIYSKKRAEALDKAACTATVWPTPANSKEALKRGPSLEEQERIKAELESKNGSFQRLKLIMDAWCALWFWPPDSADNLPSREAWLSSAALLLGHKVPPVEYRPLISARLGFEVDMLLKAAENDVPDTGILANAVPWYETTVIVVDDQPFNHWELVFTEVVGPSCVKEGFDLIVGNPPWVKATWNESIILSELEPYLGVCELSSTEIGNNKSDILIGNSNKLFYVKNLHFGFGSVTFLNSKRYYYELLGIQTNIYKNFICRSHNLINNNAIVALLHPEGIYDDPNGGGLRHDYYFRLIGHYQFRNELKLFRDIGNTRTYSINVSGSVKGKIDFISISNLFHPKTINLSVSHTWDNPIVPNETDEKGKWCLQGHHQRILYITEAELNVFRELFENKTTNIYEIRLPRIHSQQILNVVKKMSQYPKHLNDIANECFFTEMFHESNAQKNGIISRQDSPCYTPHNNSDLIILGPHIYVGCPYYQVPKSVCKTHRAFDEIDLTELSENFIPSSSYVPVKSNKSNNYQEAIPAWPDNRNLPITGNYRHIHRRRGQASAERTIMPCIIPPGPTHINSCFSITFLDINKLLIYTGSSSSIVFDFYARITGKEDFRYDIVSKLPLLHGKYCEAITNRILRLNCLTRDYTHLWENHSSKTINGDGWTCACEKLENEFEFTWDNLSSEKWYWKTPIRTQYARRQALIEIDVLVSLSLDLNLDDLINIYQVQFPVLNSYELIDEYDEKGRHIPNTARRDAGARAVRDARLDWDGESPLTVSWQIDNGLKKVTKTFYPPFTKVDREADYARAYEVFKERYGG